MNKFLHQVGKFPKTRRIAVLQQNSWFGYEKQGHNYGSLILVISLVVNVTDGDILALHSHNDCEFNKLCSFIALKIEKSKLFGQARIGKCSGSHKKGLTVIQNIWHILWLTVVANRVTLGLDRESVSFELQCVPHPRNLDFRLRVGGVNFLGNISHIIFNGKKMLLKLMK